MNKKRERKIYIDRRQRKTSRRRSIKNSDCRMYLLSQTPYERDTVEVKDIYTKYDVLPNLISKIRIQHGLEVGVSEEIKAALDPVAIHVLAELSNTEIANMEGFTKSAVRAYLIRRKKAEGYPPRGLATRAQMKDRWLL